MIYRSETKSFEPSSRLMVLLGEQLIRNSGIAVFELVKNAYDADSKQVEIIIRDVENPDETSIVVKDTGTGMDYDTVTGVWLEPGTDYRAKQKQRNIRTPIFKRLPLGEKGIGRFAVHKLGKYVSMVTRKSGCPEVVVNINWTEFQLHRYLKDAGVKVIEREPRVFKGSSTGTKIIIKNLNDKWTRGMVRELHRSIFSICSPFTAPGEFKPVFKLEPEPPKWLDDMLTIENVMKYSMFNVIGITNGKEFTYNYEFKPLPGMGRIMGRKTKSKTVSLKEDINYPSLQDLDIGLIKIDLRIFDRDPQILLLSIKDKQGFKDFLNKNGGIRVYRDGIRIFDYGEPGNDWLDLDGNRINKPAERISNNIVIGAVSLSMESSGDLVEKTNREGFVENVAYTVFKKAVFNAITQIAAERNIDKIRIRKVYGGNKKEPVTDELMILRNKIVNNKLGDDLLDMVERINSDFTHYKETLLTAAGAGLSLVVVVHEVEKGINLLSEMLDNKENIVDIRKLAKHLVEMVDGLSYISKKSGRKKERASIIIKQSIFNLGFLLRNNNIVMYNGINDMDDPDFSIMCTRRLIVSTIMNLIDNSIYWINVKGKKQKYIYVGTSNECFDSPAIIVADSGPGFSDPPEYLIEPFFSRKPDGMGIGLYIASEVMKKHGGKVVFPDPGDVDIPDKCDGAVVALVFGGAK